METLNSNKLIAEFMGWKCEYNMFWYPPNCTNFTLNNAFAEWHMKFNESWDWLMPVVEKIEDAFEVVISIYGNSCTIDIDEYKFGMSEEQIIVDADNKIEAVYGAVVSFIEWHNNTKVTSPNTITEIVDDVIFTPAERITNTPKKYPFE